MLSSRSLTLTLAACSTMALAASAAPVAVASSSSSLPDRAAAAAASIAPLLARATAALEPLLIKLGLPVTAAPALLATLPLLLLALWWLLLRGPAPLRPNRSAKIAAATGGALPQTHAVHHATYDTDVVIVGAGCAGASLGAALGKRGYRVVVVERDLTEPDRIVGELLQPSGCALLREMGLPGQWKTINTTGKHAYREPLSKDSEAHSTDCICVRDCRVAVCVCALQSVWRATTPSA